MALEIHYQDWLNVYVAGFRLFLMDRLIVLTQSLIHPSYSVAIEIHFQDWLTVYVLSYETAMFYLLVSNALFWSKWKKQGYKLDVAIRIHKQWLLRFVLSLSTVKQTNHNLMVFYFFVFFGAKFKNFIDSE